MKQSLVLRICEGLLLGIAAASSTAYAAGRTPAAEASSTAPSAERISRLQGELRQLLDQLDEIDELHAASEQPQLVAGHWQAFQSFAAHLRAALPASQQSAASPPISSAQCRLPDSVGAAAYAPRMRDLLWEIRGRLADAYAMSDPVRRAAALQALSRDTDRGAQQIRGYGWMLGSATPVPLQQPVPQSASTPAYLVSRYCGACHAPPSPALHTLGEWAGVAEKMMAHVQLADSAYSRQVEQPDAHELELIQAYLEANGCEPQD